MNLIPILAGIFLVYMLTSSASEYGKSQARYEAEFAAHQKRMDEDTAAREAEFAKRTVVSRDGQ